MVRQVRERQPSCPSPHHANPTTSHCFNYLASGVCCLDPKLSLLLLHLHFNTAARFGQVLLHDCYALKLVTV